MSGRGQPPTSWGRPSARSIWAPIVPLADLGPDRPIVRDDRDPERSARRGRRAVVGASVTTEVAIVGIGIHPFGRTDGVSRTAAGRRRGARRARRRRHRLARHAVRVRRELRGGNADALVAELGLTGIAFVNVLNGCATGGSALAMADRAIRSGAYDLGHGHRLRQAPAGRVQRRSRRVRARRLVRRDRADAHHAVLRHEDPALPARARHRPGDAGEGRGEGVPQRGAATRTPGAARRWPRRRSRRRRWSTTRSPSTCSARRPRAPSRWCCAAADHAQRYTDRAGVPAGVRDAVPRTTARSRCSARGCRSSAPTARPSHAARGRFEQAGIGPADVDVAQIQDTESGAEIMHMAETGLCEHGEQEELITPGATEIGGPLPINTDGGCLANGEPIGASGLRQVYENVLQLRGDAGDRQVPGEPQVGVHPRLRRARRSARARC